MVLKDTLRQIEYEIAMLVRLTTAHSPKLGSLDRSEYLLLSEISAHEPLAINALAEKLMLNLSTASRQIAVLEGKAYIERFPDEHNGRISLVQLTNTGRAVLQKVKEARHKVYGEILKDWSPEELAGLEASLTRLNKDFKLWGK